MGRTDFEPHPLLDWCKQLEKELGRLPGRRWGERRIDLDILLMGSLLVNEDNLTIPHPRLLERAFVLRPILDLNAHLIHPSTGQPIASYTRVEDMTRLGDAIQRKLTC